MRIFILFALFLPLSLGTGVKPAVPAQTESPAERARKVLRIIDDLWRGESSHGIISMQVKTAHYTRKLRMEGWSKGKDLSLIRIINPLKERGTSTLKSDTNIYTYLPKTDRTIRLTSGMMMSSWMGSHFTTDDLVKESRLEDDYDPTITFEGNRGGQTVLEFSLLPKPEAPVVWGKITFLIRTTDFIPLSAVYFDEDLNIARTMTFSDVKKMSGRKIPAVLHVVPADKPEEFTELIYEEMTFDLELKDSFFSLGRLKRR